MSCYSAGAVLRLPLNVFLQKREGYVPNVRSGIGAGRTAQQWWCREAGSQARGPELYLGRSDITCLIMIDGCCMLRRVVRCLAFKCVFLYILCQL